MFHLVWVHWSLICHQMLSWFQWNQFTHLMKRFKKNWLLLAPTVLFGFPPIGERPFESQGIGGNSQTFVTAQTRMRTGEAAQTRMRTGEASKRTLYWVYRSADSKMGWDRLGIWGACAYRMPIWESAAFQNEADGDAA